MPYGLKCWDSSGNLVLNVTDQITRMRYKTIATAGNNGNVTLPDISGKTTIQFGVCMESEKIPHYVYRSSTTIYWEARGESDGLSPWPSGDTQLYVFLVD